MVQVGDLVVWGVLSFYIIIALLARSHEGIFLV